MPDATTVVEKKEGEAATTTPPTVVEKKDGVTTTQPVDYQAELARVNAELAKTNEDKENYRKGMLKAKGKLPDSGNSDDDELSLDEKIAIAVKGQILDTNEAKLKQEKDELLGKVLKENSEMRVALQNRSQVSSGAQGASNETKIEPSGQFFSEAQIADLKKRGWNDAKIEAFKKNVLRNK